jgi:hypothetical protein
MECFQGKSKTKSILIFIPINYPKVEEVHCRQAFIRGITIFVEFETR